MGKLSWGQGFKAWGWVLEQAALSSFLVDSVRCLIGVTPSFYTEVQ